MHIDLLSIDETRNRYRFYSVLVNKTLFEYEIEIQWGRIDAWKRRRKISAGDLEDVANILKANLQRRFRHGYQVTSHALVDDLIDLSDIEISFEFAA